MSETINKEEPGRDIESLVPDISAAVRLACFLYKFRVSQEEISDLTSEIVILLLEDDFRRLQLFDSARSSFKTWLKAIVFHHVGHYLRRRKAEISIEDLSPARAIYEANQNEIVWHRQQKEALQQATGQLSEREQELLNTCLRDDLNSEEKAMMLGIKLDSLYSRKCIVINKLRRLLSHHYEQYTGIEKGKKNSHQKV